MRTFCAKAKERLSSRRSVWLSVLCQSTDMLGVVVAVREDCNLLSGSEVWGIVQGAYAQYALAPCSPKTLEGWHDPHRWRDQPRT